VLITDAWQDKGIGSILTDYCMEIAEHWGVKHIIAQTTTDNQRMLAVFKKRDFEIETDSSTSMVEVCKALND